MCLLSFAVKIDLDKHYRDVEMRQRERRRRGKCEIIRLLYGKF